RCPRVLHCSPTRRSSDLRHGDLDVRALVGLLQADLEVVPQVRTPARTVLARPAPGAAAEDVAERVAEDLGKDVVDVGEALALARSEEHTSELQSRENLVC